MITMSILAIIAVIVLVVGVIFLIVGGSTFIIMFADLIVCAWIIFTIIRLLKKRRG